MKGLVWNLDLEWWRLSTPTRQAVHTLVMGGGAEVPPEEYTSTVTVVGAVSKITEGTERARRLGLIMASAKPMTMAAARLRLIRFYDRNTRLMSDEQRDVLAGFVMFQDPCFHAPIASADRLIRKALTSASTNEGQLRMFDDALRETLRCVARMKR